MKHTVSISLTIFLFILNSFSFGDTFKNRQTKESLHGYVTSRTINGKTIVHTQESNDVPLSLIDYEITQDALGRNNNVIVIKIDNALMLENTAKALERAFVKDADKGPLFILLELDTPGGSIYLAQRISAAISRTDNCQIICFINGGENGGAISAGVAVALACNKIYMADNTIMGGATPIVLGKNGPKDFKKAYGDAVGEKYNSIWRANLASSAERNARPALLAKAMVDKNIQVIEIADANGKKAFISPVDKKPGHTIVKTWNAPDTILTLTAGEAAQCGMSDKLVASRQDVLTDMKAEKAEIIVDDCYQQARQEINRAELGYKQLRQSLDLKIKRFKDEKVRSKALTNLREIKADFQSLVMLAKKYPDLDLNVEKIQRELNSVQAAYEHAVSTREIAFDMVFLNPYNISSDKETLKGKNSWPVTLLN